MPTCLEWTCQQVDHGLPSLLTPAHTHMDALRAAGSLYQHNTWLPLLRRGQLTCRHVLRGTCCALPIASSSSATWRGRSVAAAAARRRCKRSSGTAMVSARPACPACDWVDSWLKAPRPNREAPPGTASSVASNSPLLSLPLLCCSRSSCSCCCCCCCCCCTSIHVGHVAKGARCCVSSLRSCCRCMDASCSKRRKRWRARRSL
jgi:hypothetical protein